mmetsp:Transcript_62956/g.150629  ORF Transcript_62956/g.150629 Transcript_62956/m.150629 type:complete len:377 (-) Transcript_62956:14-1144(-)
MEPRIATPLRALLSLEDSILAGTRVRLPSLCRLCLPDSGSLAVRDGRASLGLLARAVRYPVLGALRMRKQPAFLHRRQRSSPGLGSRRGAPRGGGGGLVFHAGAVGHFEVVAFGRGELTAFGLRRRGHVARCERAPFLPPHVADEGHERACAGLDGHAGASGPGEHLPHLSGGEAIDLVSVNLRDLVPDLEHRILCRAPRLDRHNGRRARLHAQLQPDRALAILQGRLRARRSPHRAPFVHRHESPHGRVESARQLLRGVEHSVDRCHGRVQAMAHVVRQHGHRPVEVVLRDRRALDGRRGRGRGGGRRLLGRREGEAVEHVQAFLHAEELAAKVVVLHQKLLGLLLIVAHDPAQLPHHLVHLVGSHVVNRLRDRP